MEVNDKEILENYCDSIFCKSFYSTYENENSVYNSIIPENFISDTLNDYIPTMIVPEENILGISNIFYNSIKVIENEYYTIFYDFGNSENIIYNSPEIDIDQIINNIKKFEPLMYFIFFLVLQNMFLLEDLLNLKIMIK